jgi:glutamate-5-semialdehyde dehydrogenase
MNMLDEMGRKARVAARGLVALTSAQKHAALLAIAAQLRSDSTVILAANALDVLDARSAGLSDSLIDRLLLTPARLEAIAADVENVASLDDPVGETFAQRTLANGLPAYKLRVPIGVIGVIYEARPNVTVDVATLCLKTGNACILRGGTETARSNHALVASLQRALTGCAISPDAMQVVADQNRELVLALLRLDKYVDMIIPRGGAGLHKFCREHATVPVVTGGIGVCHMFVDATANLAATVPVVHNAKVQRPSVCNALDTLLVHRDIAARLLPEVGADLAAAGVEIRADAEALALLRDSAGDRARLATLEDFGVEFLALVLSIKVVSGLDEALDHIWQYSTGHSESVLTEDAAVAERFVRDVDSAGVFINASTRFNDGGQLGLGAEVAVSTQKLHARGPMGLAELTTFKWVVGSVDGDRSGYFSRP